MSFEQYLNLVYSWLVILFDIVGPPLEDIAEEEEPAEAEDDGEDEMADFIVDEEFDEAGVPVRYVVHCVHAYLWNLTGSCFELHFLIGD